MNTRSNYRSYNNASSLGRGSTRSSSPLNSSPPNAYDTSKSASASGWNSYRNNYSDESKNRERGGGGGGGGDSHGGRSAYSASHSGRGQYLNNNNHSSKNSHEYTNPREHSSSYSKSQYNTETKINTPRSTTYTSMDTTKPTSHREYSSSVSSTTATPTTHHHHRISFQPPDHIVSKTADRRYSPIPSSSSSSLLDTRPTTHGHGNPSNTATVTNADPTDAYAYPNKRFRPNIEWQPPTKSVEDKDHDLRNIRQLNFTKPPSIKTRDDDSMMISHNVVSNHHHHPSVQVPSTTSLAGPGTEVYKRTDPRLERGRLTQPQPTVRSLEVISRTKSFYSSLIGRQIVDKEEEEEEGEVSTYSPLPSFQNTTSSGIDSFVKANDTMNHMTRLETTQETIQVGKPQCHVAIEVDSPKDKVVLEEHKVITNEPVPSNPVPTRPPSPAAGPPSGIAIALSRLVDLQSQMEYQYTKYLLLCKEHEICKVKVDVIKNLPVGLDAIRDDLEMTCSAKLSSSE